MKKKLLIFTLATFTSIALFVSCTADDDDAKATILPESFNVEVPNSLASAQATVALAPSNRLKVNDVEVSGNDLYDMMRAFVFIGNASGKFLTELITAIKIYNIDKPMTFSFISDDDNRAKQLIVTENVTFEGVQYSYKMVIIDVQNPNNPVHGLEMYWNRTPVRGLAIMQGYNLNRYDNSDLDARIRIDYSEATAKYEKQMEITIVDLDIDGIREHVDNLKMFVGKNGTQLDVYGNANLPNYQIIDKTHANGYNWAFVAHVNEELNIAVAKVALPTTVVSTTENIFTNYSMEKVLDDEIQIQYPLEAVNSVLRAAILKNSKAPAYFSGGLGFIGCGEVIPTTAPAGFTTEFVDLTSLSPYVPSVVNALTIKFGFETVEQ